MKKQIKYFIVAFLTMFIATIGVSAEECSDIENEDGLTRALSDGCAQVTLKKGSTIEGDFEITKNVEIVGNEATIKGTIEIKGEGIATVAISDLTMTGGNLTSGAQPEYISVKSTNVKLNVSNVKIYYDDMENSSSFIQHGTGIVVYNSDGNGSTVTVTDSIIHTKYAIWIEGSNSDLIVKDSELSGYAALDLTSGSTETSDNDITIDNSKLTGYAIGKSESGNNYGTIVIGHKKDVTINITNNSTITNNFDNGGGARSDLILISNANNKATNAKVNVSDSMLINTAESTDLGAVYNANETTDNSFKTENTTIEGNLIAGDEGHYYVEFVVDGKSSVVLVTKDGKLSSEDIPNAYKSGYTFNGWYDEEGNYFNAGEDITGSIKVIAKFTSSSSSTPSKKDYNIVENVVYADNGEDIEIDGKIVKDTDETYKAMIKMAEDKGYKTLYNMYDFWVKDNKSLNKPVTITFNLGESYNGKMAYVIHKLHDGSYQELEAEVVDGKVSITVKELSPFTLSLKDNAVVDNPQTSSMNIIASGILTTMSLVGIIVLVKKRNA